MADFCNQCRAEHGFGDPEDSDYPKGRPAPKPGFGYPEICEGCGFTCVDHFGNCLGGCLVAGHGTSSSCQ